MSTPYCIVVFTILNIGVVTAGVIRSTRGTSGFQSRTGILLKPNLFQIWVFSIMAGKLPLNMSFVLKNS